MVPSVDRSAVLYTRSSSESVCPPQILRHTLNAKFFKACATPGLGSYRLPALTRKVSAVVGWPWSTAATLTPETFASTTVANERARRFAVDARVASISAGKALDSTTHTGWSIFLAEVKFPRSSPYLSDAVYVSKTHSTIPCTSITSMQMNRMLKFPPNTRTRLIVCHGRRRRLS